MNAQEPGRPITLAVTAEEGDNWASSATRAGRDHQQMAVPGRRSFALIAVVRRNFTDGAGRRFACANRALRIAGAPDRRRVKGPEAPRRSAGFRVQRPLRASSGGGNDVLDVRHVAPGGVGGLVRSAPALASVHVRRVPVPPVVRWGGRLERAVTLGRLMQQIRQGGDVHCQSSHSRPGIRVVTSWSSHALPSGSLNDAYAKYERPGTSNPGGFGCSSTSLTSIPRLTRSSRAASMSWTARYKRSSEPGSIAVSPFPKWMEHCERGGVICTCRKSSLTTRSMSIRPPRLSEKRLARSTSETGSVTTSSFMSMVPTSGVTLDVSVLA